MKKFLSAGIILFALGALLYGVRAQGNAPPQSSNNATGTQQSQNVESTTIDEDYKTGMARYEAKQYKQAVEAFKQSLRRKPGDARTHYDLGMTYYRMSRYREASAEYRQAVQLKPDWAEARFRLGWMYYILGMTRPAREQYNALEKLDPGMAVKLARILKDSSPEPEARAVVKSNDEVPAQSSEPAQPSIITAGGEKNPGTSTVEANTRATSNDASTRTDDSASKPPATSHANTASTKTADANQAKLSGSKQAKTEPDLNASNASPKDAGAAPAKISALPNSNNAPVKTDAGSDTGASKMMVADSPRKIGEATPTSIYRIGAGDVLDIRLLNTPTSRSTLYTVMEGGLVEYPLAGGPLGVAGMTPSEIEARLTEELKRRGINEKSRVVVSVREYASHTVILSGVVNSPGVKILHREAVPLYVLLAEAQPRVEAGRVVITRASGQIPVIDLNDPSAVNALIYPGDVITVLARQPQFYYIAGNVNTPGQKSFQPGITLLQSILAAGGLSRSGNVGLLSRSGGHVIELSREGDDGRLMTTKYSLKEIKAGKLPDPRLQPGDRIEVRR